MNFFFFFFFLGRALLGLGFFPVGLFGGGGEGLEGGRCMFSRCTQN